MPLFRKLAGMFDALDDAFKSVKETPKKKAPDLESKAPSLSEKPILPKKKKSTPDLREKPVLPKKTKKSSPKSKSNSKSNYVPDSWFLDQAADKGKSAKSRYYTIRQKLTQTGISGEDDLDRLAAWWMDRGNKDTRWRGEDRAKKYKPRKKKLEATLQLFTRVFGDK